MNKETVREWRQKQARAAVAGTLLQLLDIDEDEFLAVENWYPPLLDYETKPTSNVTSRPRARYASSAASEARVLDATLRREIKRAIKLVKSGAK